MGSVFAGRFEVEKEAGRGGMGVVYRARDHVTGDTVALKIMTEEGDRARFTREAAMLERITHPGIVRYVAHGELESGALWLAMQWLEGEELAARLARKGLSVGEALSLIRHTAEALRAAHAKGVVHRDIKPSNIFLVGRDVDRAVLLDFGIARAERQNALTATGSFIGTLGYASPEHTQGKRDLDGRSDIYSLGCVLYECLTGRKAFPGSTPLEILAKAMLESVPDVRDTRPEVSPMVSALVARMTERVRERRFEDASALLAALVELEQTPTTDLRSAAPKAALMRSEQRLACLLLLISPDSTVATSTTQGPSSIEHQESRARAVIVRAGASLQREGRAAGAELRVLANGLLATFTGAESAVDLASIATRVAISLKTIYPDMEAGLAIGRLEGDVAAGTLLTTALDLLDCARGSGLLRVDQATARLIESRFVVDRRGGASVVLGSLDADAPVRTLLGKPTPCVGRDKELRLLESTLDECEDESVARSVLVTAPPGVGKTRLMREFSDRAKARGSTRVLRSAAEQGASRASLSLVSGLVLSAAKVPAGASKEVCERAIFAHLATLLPPEKAETTAEFLVELCNAKASPRSSALFATAKNEPRIMNEWMLRSFEEWLVAESEKGSVALVLEDVHWADSASFQYVAGALKRCAERPLLVLMLARPEVLEVLPDAITRGPLQVVRLGALTKRSAERLAEIAAPELPAAMRADLVERAQGNAFYLEELLRWVSDRARRDSTAITSPSAPSAIPESVLLMAQSRLETFEPGARRVLRAASVFGGSAWAEGIEVVLADEAGIAIWIDLLLREELLEARPSSRFPGTREVAFRHALVREAAYATLTEEDRREGHRRAAEWLERVGERDPMLLAEHLSQAGESERAAPFFLGAAALAADAGNLVGAIELSARGLDHGASGATKGLLLATRAYAHGWRAEWPEVLEFAPLAMELLDPGTVPWWLVAGGTVFAGASTANPTRTPAVVKNVMALPGHPDPSGPCGFAMALLTLGLMNAGERAGAEAFLGRFKAIAAAHAERDAVFDGWLHLAIDAMALYGADDPLIALQYGREGTRFLELAQDPIGRSITRVYEGVARFEAGDALNAIASFDAAIVIADEKHIHYSRVLSRAYRARALLGLGDPKVVVEAAKQVVGETDRLVSSIASSAVAEAYLALGDFEQARAHASRVAGGPLVLPQAAALAVLAKIELQASNPAGALEHAERGLALVAKAIYPRTRSQLELLRGHALSILGRAPEATGVFVAAAARLRRIAERLAPEGLGAAWLELPTHRAILAMVNAA